MEVAGSAASGRTWRIAFLTLRDETLMSSSHTSFLPLLDNLIFSNSSTLITDVSQLPPHEVTSDVMLMLELAVGKTSEGPQDMADTFVKLCHLINGVSHRVGLEMNSSYWTLVLNSLGRMVELFVGKVSTREVQSGNSASIRATIECLETIRCICNTYRRKCSLSDIVQLVKFLLSVVEWSHASLYSPSYSSGNQRCAAESESKIPRDYSLWEVQTIAFSMIGDLFSSFGTSFQVDTWQSTIEVLRKVIDILASKTLLVEDNVRSRFYTALLDCLHMVLMDPKCSISDHVAGFVAGLRKFFTYGLSDSGRTQTMHPVANNKDNKLISPSLGLTESRKSESGPYRPPHLRKKDGPNILKSEAPVSLSSFEHNSSFVEHMSSDSDYSDSDGSVKNEDGLRSSKARVASIICIQDLCQADPKSFTAQWTMLLPTNDVLQPRNYEANLMTCLLFDPYLKARIASASTLAAMLDGAPSVFLQIAEYKESARHGSFTALSSSLGQILMQLHSGILYSIQRENRRRLLAPLFKILILLISSTPYSRMPVDLLPAVISSLQTRIEAGFPGDQTGLLALAISCLTAALSTSPSSLPLQEMILVEISTGTVETRGKPAILHTIFQYSEQVTSPMISFEALQALRAVSHNYPNVIVACWEQVSTIVYKMLRLTIPEVPRRSWDLHGGNTVGSAVEKVVTAAIKVLDECLRAISGFNGTEDPFDEKLLNEPFASDCIRTKKISSAPSYGLEDPEIAKYKLKACRSGDKEWSEAIENHLPIVLNHSSPVVRAASVTCFAGITSSVFSSLSKQNQDFILSSSITAAVKDEAPTVKSAGCRAIGVMACFPQISHSAEIITKFIHAAEINTHNQFVSVRITASWALANICDSIRHCISMGLSSDSALIASLAKCALRLTTDGDKVKSNAVRALGNLSRFVQFESNLLNSASSRHSHWLDQMVQAFLSCVTTGNVKVQWNVCHALNNLFQNGTLRLQDMNWAPSVFSILLLLLRDSSNYKIRIQAAAALAVPASIVQYGTAFPDVVQSLEHILENVGSLQNSVPASYQYRVALEKQLTSTTLHVLGLSSATDNQALKDFLIKKATFFEEWFKVLCASLGEISTQSEADSSSNKSQKTEIVCKAIKSLVDLYEAMNHHAIAERFKKLLNSIL